MDITAGLWILLRCNGYNIWIMDITAEIMDITAIFMDIPDTLWNISVTYRYNSRIMDITVKIYEEEKNTSRFPRKDRSRKNIAFKIYCENTPKPD